MSQRRRKKSSSIESSAGRISTRSTSAHIGSGHYYSHGDRKGKTSICRIDQEGACNTKENAYQATTHSISLIKKNDSATRAYRQLKFLDKFIEHHNADHQNYHSMAKIEWNMHALCEGNFCLTLPCTQPFLSKNVVQHCAQFTGWKNEAWRKLKLSNWKAWTGGSSCSLSPSE